MKSVVDGYKRNVLKIINIIVILKTLCESLDFADNFRIASIDSIRSMLIIKLSIVRMIHAKFFYFSISYNLVMWHGQIKTNKKIIQNYDKI